ncbi:MAG: transglycosylase domain-containing protein, partial [Microvirga sp.]
MALAIVCLVAAFALWSFANSLGPLDLSAAEKRSTVVLDRDGRLLRPFATADGRWRLPVAAADVDPRFLAMLKAYEDARFDRHPGIDPMALLRAAGQLLTHGRV